MGKKNGDEWWVKQKQKPQFKLNNIQFKREKEEITQKLLLAQSMLDNVYRWAQINQYEDIQKEMSIADVSIHETFIHLHKVNQND